MATITKYKINGVETEPFREAQDVTISADFGTEAQPSLDIDSIRLVDSAGALNSKTVRDLWALNPVEGAPFSIQVTDNTNSFDFDFFFDYTKMNFLSNVETDVGLKKNQSLTEFDFRAQGITQRLLEAKGFLGLGTYQPVPYIIANRKTDLEKIQLLSNTFQNVKTIIDEVFKLINIAADITSGGIAQAIINLTTTIAALIVLKNQLIALLQDIQDTFFPPVRYHAGLKPKVFIEKAVDYMGYDGVEFGTLSDIMDQLTWVGSKNNEIGFPQYALLGVGQNALNLLSGLFKPADAGYFLSDCIDILSSQFRLRRAIINNVLHLRPENDPFWTTQSGYTLPTVKVEQIFADNGTFRPNYDDVNSSLIVEYSVDDSDLWTMEDLADDADPNTTGKIITVKTIEPINVTDQRKVLLRGSKQVKIPHCLATRNNTSDSLLAFFTDSIDAFNGFGDAINDIIGQFGSILGTGNQNIEQFTNTAGNRVGAMKIENHYFSVPKQMLIVDGGLGLPTIPADYIDKIGSTALVENYHSWDSFIQGERNPAEPNQTAAKFVYEGVRIPFGLDDFVVILNNAYFQTQSGAIGKFLKVDWNVRGDFAVVDYWIYNNWMSNVEEIIS